MTFASIIIIVFAAAAILVGSLYYCNMSGES